MQQLFEANSEKIQLRYRDLGPVHVDSLREAVFAQDEAAWQECEHRQRAYDVHHDTDSIVLLFCSETWPDVAISRMQGWERLANAAQPLMDDILRRYYPPGGVILRAMAARLKAGGSIAPHVDSLPSFRAGHRIHAPLLTHSGVRFTIDGQPCKMEVGRAYEINNQLAHSVLNTGPQDRIHFIFDYLPPERV